MAQFQIAFKERTVAEGRPGFQWLNKTELVQASTEGAAVLSLYYKKDVIIPGRVVVLE